MLRALVASFFFSFTLLLAACGGGSGSAAGGSGGPPASSLSSVAVKGVLKGATIKVLRWEAGAYVEVEVVETQGDGTFTLTLADRQPGDVYKLLLAHSASDAPITMVCDAEHCGSQNFGDDTSFNGDLELTSWVTVGSDGAVTIMPVTPVSTLLVSYAEFMGNGRLSSSNLTVARSRVAALFRMSPADLLATPGNIASATMMATMTDASRKISLLSAAFAELSGGNAGQMGANIQRYSQAFIDNNGRLLEADNSGVIANLHDLYVAAYAMADLATSSATQRLALGWTNAFIDALQDGEFSSTCHNPAGCAELNSERFVDALGPMGQDVRAVISQHGYTKLEDAIAGELRKFGWLVSEDTFSFTGAAFQTVGYAASAVVNRLAADVLAELLPSEAFNPSDFQLFPLLPLNGLTPALTGNTLKVTGTQTDGLEVDLTVTLPVVWSAMGGNKKFPLSLTGTIGNEQIGGEVDASILIDATGTDFEPLMTSLRGAVTSALASMMGGASEGASGTGDGDEESSGLLDSPEMKAVIADMIDLAKTAKFKVDIDFQKARLVKKDNNSQLSIEGQGYVNVDMKGGESGRITLNGAVSGGRITLPNGSWFGVGQGESLTFSMNKDGRFDADVSVSILTLFKAKGYGNLKNMGVMVSDLRDDVVTLLKGLAGGADGETADIGGLLTRLITNIGSLDLLVEGDVTMMEQGKSYSGHVYKARLANTVLTISQPNQSLSNKALELSLGWDGLHVAAGNSWWHFGLDLSTFPRPAVLIADDQGGEWRYDFDFSELLAMN